MVKMNGALRAPPLTAPPGLALRLSRQAPLVLARLLNGKRILIPRNAVIAFLESCH